MILVSLFALVSTPQDIKPADLVSKMLARYHDAKTLSGTVLMTQSAAGRKVYTETSIQYEKPAKLYIKQVLKASEPRQWLVTSDGTNFSYDVPNDQRDNNWIKEARLVEMIGAGAAAPSLSEIYRAVTRSLGDRSAALDVAIGRLEDLKFLRGQWKTLDSGPQVEVEGEKLYSIQGLWREYGDAQIHSGTYQMFLNAEGDLRRYEVRVSMRLPLGNGQVSEPQEILTSWDVRFKVNGSVVPELFKLVK